MPDETTAEIESALARASRLGDRAAFEQLVRRTARLLFARFYLNTGDKHRSEDLVQETYLLAWQRVRQLDDPTRFRGWLNQIAQSVLIDSMQRARAGNDPRPWRRAAKLT